jgi:membrane-associated phospholipid phosphatase
MRRSLAFVSFGCVWLATTHASAGPPPDDSIDWRWRRFQAWEYAATAAALGTGFYLRFGTNQPDADWKGGILFDDWIRDRTAIHNPETRTPLIRLTDAMFYGAMGYRLFDSVVVPGLIRGNADTALQMSLIDLEVFGFVAITLWGSQAIFGRERPEVDRCGEPAFRESEPSCKHGSAEPNRSFYAGHPAVGMAAAGLTCVHHANLPLYGGGAGDTLPCGAMIGAAVMNGVGRVLTENHYATDLVVGLGLGAVAGWVLPQVLHYNHPRPRVPSTAGSRSPPHLHASIVPIVGDDRLGVSLSGVF